MVWLTEPLLHLGFLLLALAVLVKRPVAARALVGGLTEVMYRTNAVVDANNRETRRCLTQAQAIDYNVITRRLD